MEHQAFQRVAIVGATGSGKTSLARAVGRRLGVAHIELDALFWERGWQKTLRAVFQARVAAAVAADGWVTDGNYHMVRELVWRRATTLIWLDYPLSLVLWRLVKRTVRRVAQREVLWNGNRERVGDFLFSRDSLFLWALQSHPRQRREYPLELALPKYAHLEKVRLRSPRATERWLSGLGYPRRPFNQ